MSDFLIRLDEVVKRYALPSGASLTVINGVDLHVRPGEFITLVGPSGCGKSTLLRLLLGSEQPTEGSVQVAGKSLERPCRDRGMVYQKYSLFPHLTVLDNVAYGLDLEQMSMPGRFLRPFHYRRLKKAHHEQALGYLERVGLAEAAEKYPHQLSGGMRQRVAIAQSAIMEPQILLMDEPFGALDDATRQEMQLFILEQWERLGMTIFFVTHDLEEALYLGTRILVLSQYYRDDMPTQGAKLVVDRQIAGGHPKPTDFKYSEEFTDLLRSVREGGLDPNFRQHVREFDLTHQDAIVRG